MTSYAYTSPEECDEASDHLRSVDNDGYCNNCGHPPFDNDKRKPPPYTPEVREEIRELCKDWPPVEPFTEQDVRIAQTANHAMAYTVDDPPLELAEPAAPRMSDIVLTLHRHPTEQSEPTVLLQKNRTPSPPETLTDADRIAQLVDRFVPTAMRVPPDLSKLFIEAGGEYEKLYKKWMAVFPAAADYAEQMKRLPPATPEEEREACHVPPLAGTASDYASMEIAAAVALADLADTKLPDASLIGSYAPNLPHSISPTGRSARTYELREADAELRALAVLKPQDKIMIDVGPAQQEARIWQKFTDDFDYDKEFYLVRGPAVGPAEEVMCWPNAGLMNATDGSGRYWDGSAGVECRVMTDEEIEEFHERRHTKKHTAVVVDWKPPKSSRAAIGMDKGHADRTVLAVSAREPSSVDPTDLKKRPTPELVPATVIEVTPGTGHYFYHHDPERNTEIRAAQLRALAKPACLHSTGIAGGYSDCSICGINHKHHKKEKKKP